MANKQLEPGTRVVVNMESKAHLHDKEGIIVQQGQQAPPNPNDEEDMHVVLVNGSYYGIPLRNLKTTQLVQEKPSKKNVSEEEEEFLNIPDPSAHEPYFEDADANVAASDEEPA